MAPARGDYHCRRSVLLMIVEFVIVTHAVEEYVRVQLYLPLIDYSRKIWLEIYYLF
jgi:hypothetical protein